MKILYVLSQVELTGAETYALTLASSLQKKGHSIVFVSEKLQETGSFKYYSLPLHTRNTSTLGRIQNVFSLRKIIRDERIDLVHSHSRAANLVSYFAAGKSVPIVVTVHGRWRNHFAARTLPCLGEKTIAVCPYLERYLVFDIRRPPGTIRMAPNGIDSEKFSPSPERQENGFRILFVGRFSGQKGNVIRFLLREIFPDLARRFPESSFQICSSPASKEDKALVAEFNRICRRESVSIEEGNRDLVSQYRQATLVVGSGRVTLEAMSCARPVFSIGESSAPGVLTPENFEKAFDSNFGDCGEWNLFLGQDKKNMIEEISAILQDKEGRATLSQWGRRIVREKFQADRVADQVLQVYEEVLR
ncbi:MAG: glycosyltransferase [Elusimicrobia bacterium]|nr:glycosyltransferase [Elusimicrobiota bacterium]MBI2915327.1 glycosyltransferase [Elusimicrobiota bacterium]MBI3012985.1 glycosyltransferase [Elusimicrobiota bacterium]